MPKRGEQSFVQRNLRNYLRLSVLAIALLTACSKVSTQSGTITGSNPWTHHGVLRMDELAEPDNLNPIVGNQQIEVDLSMFWAGYLMRFNDRNEFVPELATEVPTLANGGISRNGLLITYHLRHNVRWDDGAPFTADDVIYTWHQIMSPNNNVSSRSGYDDISRIERLNDYTIVVHLKRPYAPFISDFFSIGSTPMPILPKHILAAYPSLNRVPYNNHPVGIGPFKVGRYEKGSTIIFVANPSYWRGTPRLREIDVRFVPDENTIATQLRTHETDMEFNADPGYLPLYRAIPGVRVYITPIFAYAQLGLNLANPMLADRRVRQALSYAIDKNQIVKKAAHGIPTVADADQPPSMWSYNPNIKRYAFDPEKASALLDAAGWKRAGDGFRYKGGQRLSLQITSNVGHGTPHAIEVMVQQAWHNVGVDASIKEYSTPLYFATYQEGGIMQSGKFDVAFFGWINGADPDDSTQFMCDQVPPAGENIYHFCDPKLDAAERVAITSYDQAKRKAAYDEIQNILSEEVPTIYIWFTNRVGVVNSDLRNYKPAHAASTMWNPWEWSI